jgi:hypothetical protein
MGSVRAPIIQTTLRRRERMGTRCLETKKTARRSSTTYRARNSFWHNLTLLQVLLMLQSPLRVRIQLAPPTSHCEPIPGSGPGGVSSCLTKAPARSTPSPRSCRGSAAMSGVLPSRFRHEMRSRRQVCVRMRPESTRLHWHYIAPGKPVQNAFVESFNNRLRHECLNEQYLPEPPRGPGTIEAWRDD